MKDGCCAVAVLADDATFLLAVNRMVAFRTQSKNRPHKFKCQQPHVPTSTHAVGTELSSLSFDERATPMSPSLTYYSVPWNSKMMHCGIIFNVPSLYGFPLPADLMKTAMNFSRRRWRKLQQLSFLITLLITR